MNDTLQVLKIVKKIKKNCKPNSKCKKCPFHIGLSGYGVDGCIFKKGVPCSWLGEDLLIDYYKSKEGAE